MAQTTVSDFVIWAKHLKGDPSLVDRILDLKAGQTITLQVDGVQGAWCKMDDGRDGRPTRGIRPLGKMQSYWRDAYGARRGDVVTVSLVDSSGGATLPISPPAGQSDAERSAAIDGFLGLAGQGWRSDEPYGSRDELYDR